MKSPLLLFLALATAQAADAPPKPEEQPFLNAGFELPKIAARTPEPKGANPALLAIANAEEREKQTQWAHFQTFGIPADNAGEGALVVGLTNELARSGKQSLYVDFQKLQTKGKSAFLMSDLVPVKGGNTYRVSIWGRIDRKRPLTLDQRKPYMQLEVTFFKEGAEEQTGDPEVRTQMIPGKLDRLIFVSGKWNEFFGDIRTPDDAALMQITFRWQTTNDAGTTDGLIYFDDAVIARIPGRETLAPPTAESDEAEAKPGEPAEEPKAGDPKR
jgi:hypothetical protein